MIQGWRNLWRNLRRTLITSAVVAVGLMTLIVSYGLIEGFVPQIVEGGARTLNGHILIQARGYHRKKSLELLLKKPKQLHALLAKDSRLEVYSTRLVARGLLGSAEGARGVRLLGVDPKRDAQVISLYSKIRQGRAPQPTSKKVRASSQTVEVLIGQKLANKLKVELGGRLVFQVVNLKGTTSKVLMRVCGIYATGSPGFDGQYIVTHRQEAARFLRAGQQLHQFVIRVKKLDDIKAVTASLTSKLKPQTKGLEILPWWKYSPEIEAMVDMMSVSIGIMLLFIFPIVLLGCLNTMLMSAYERSREVGIMKALGTRSSQILRIFFWEAVFIGIVGAVVGLILGTTCSLYFEAIGGMSLRPFMSEDVKMMVSGIALDPVMWVHTSIATVAIPTVSVILSTICAGLYPAWKVSRLKPAEAILFQ